MKRLLFVLAALVVIAAAGAGVAYTLYARLETPFRGYTTVEQYVDVPAGLGTKAIGERLVAAGVIADELTFRLALWRSDTARRLQAGEYRFDHAMTPVDVLAKIARGDVERVRITFPEGLTIGEMARIFEESGLGSARDFVAAAGDVSFISQDDPAARSLEGYLFPDTYDLPRRTTAADLTKVMVTRFRTVTGPEFAARAEALGRTVRELVTLASLVERETARTDERPVVAAVYGNRLRIKMALQCDPTVIYALQTAGRYTGNLTRANLTFDSPYNTYRYPGLPPGPIAAPGKSSLDAAANPATVDYLYFVSRNDGSHEFAKTLREHNRNVRKYQVARVRTRTAAGR